MIRRPPRATRTVTLLPNTTLFPSQRLSPQQVEVLCPVRRHDDLDVFPRGEIQESLQASARVLGPLALVAVRQQQDESARLRPAVLCRDRKSTRLNSSHYCAYRMPSSAWTKY